MSKHNGRSNGHKPPTNNAQQAPVPNTVQIPHTGRVRVAMPFSPGDELDLQVRREMKTGLQQLAMQPLSAMLGDGRAYVVQLTDPHTLLAEDGRGRVMAQEIWITLADIRDVGAGEWLCPYVLPPHLRDEAEGATFSVDMPRGQEDNGATETRYFYLDKVGYRRLSVADAQEKMAQAESGGGEGGEVAPEGEREV